MAAPSIDATESSEMPEEYEPPLKKDRLELDTEETGESNATGLQKEKKDLKTLCKSRTIETFAKLHRLDKYVSSLFMTLKEALDNNSDVPDKLSKKWCAEFKLHIVNLPSRQTINIMITSLHHLTRDCIEPLETNPLDDNSVKTIPLLSQLLCIYLRGVHMAEHTVPALIFDKFLKVMDSLKILLGRLGSALLHKEHSHTLMVSFLSLCLAWGDLQAILIYYRPQHDISEMPKLFQTDTTAENLSGFHSYLTSDQWSLVAQRITNFGEPLCKHLLDELVLQKLRVMVLFDNFACKDASMVAAKHLTTIVDEKWCQLLGSNGLLLTDKLDTTQLMSLASHIVKDVASKESWSSDQFKKPGFQENRSLVLALLFKTLSEIAKLFSTPKRKRDSSILRTSTASSQLVQNIFPLLDSTSLLLDTDAHALDKVTSKIISSMASCIVECFEETEETLKRSSLKVDMTLLERYLSILRALPVEYLPQGTQTVVLCCLIALSVSLQTIYSGDETDKMMITLEVLHKDLLLGLLDGVIAPNLAKHLHPGLLVRWLLSADLQLDEKHRRKLLNLLFNMSLNDVSSLTLLEVGVPLLGKVVAEEELVSAAHVESAAILLQAMSKFRKLEMDVELNSVCRKYVRRLCRNLVSVVQRGNIADNYSSKLVVETYHIVLQMNLLKKDATKLSKITQHLDMFIKMALPGLSNGDEHCIVFMTLLLKHRQKLASILSTDFLLDIVPQTWTVLSKADKVTEHHKTLLEVASLEQFLKITDNLIKQTTLATSSSSADPSMLEKSCALWTSVITAKLDHQKDKNRNRLRALMKLYGVLLTATQLGHVTNIKPILQFNLSVVNSKQIKLQEEMIGFCLESITVMALEDLSTISLAIQLLAALLQQCSELVLDLIPAFLQRYSHLVVAVATQGRQDSKLNTKEEIILVTACSHSLEKLANSMVVNNKHFQRIAPYIVADILQPFEVSTLRPDVKLHFLNAVYSFLKICDSHAIGYLTHALMPASKQIFETVYQDYVKHYQFTGRV